FDTAGGVIGRADGCDWSLPDPDSVLSRRHCEILFSSGALHLADTSSNGVFVNGSAEPVGPGGQYRIADGDLIQLGQYELEARIVRPERADRGPDAEPGLTPFGATPPFADPLYPPPPSFDSGSFPNAERPPPADGLWDLPEDSARVDDPFGLGGGSTDSWLS